MPKSTPEPVQTPEGGQVENPAESGGSAPTVPASGQPAGQSDSSDKQSDRAAHRGADRIEVESDPSKWEPPADADSIPELPSKDSGSVMDPRTQQKAEDAAGAPAHETPKDAQQ